SSDQIHRQSSKIRRQRITRALDAGARAVDRGRIHDHGGAGTTEQGSAWMPRLDRRNPVIVQTLVSPRAPLQYLLRGHQRPDAEVLNLEQSSMRSRQQLERPGPLGRSVQKQEN